jgi:hypothetical protein
VIGMLKTIANKKSKETKTWMLLLIKKTNLMSDDKNKQHGRDRSQVAGNEDYEVQYMAVKLNVSKERVKEAIKAVSNDREKIQEYLSQK